MKYSLILTIDCPRKINLDRPSTRKIHITELDESADYEDLGKRWKNHKHRKYCGLVSQAVFDRIVSHCDLIMEDIETGGMLGAPGFDMDWLPAFSFNNNDEDRMIGMYTCPLPTTIKEKKRYLNNQDGWDKLKKKMLEKYS